MGWMEFVVALTAHLVSWPVVVLIVAVVFRSSLRELIDRLTTFEGMGQKFSFGNAQRRAEASAGQVLPSGASPETADQLKEQEEALRGVEEEPALSIISTWERLTLAIDGLAILLPQVGDRWLPVPAKVQALRKAGVVNDAFVSAVNELRLMRNSVAHGRYRPSPGEAAAYGRTALELERACEVLLMMRKQQGGGDEVL